MVFIKMTPGDIFTEHYRQNALFFIDDVHGFDLQFLIPVIHVSPESRQQRTLFCARKLTDYVAGRSRVGALGVNVCRNT